MKRPLTSAFIAYLIVVASSCNNCKATLFCSGGTLNFRPIGYNAADIDSVWLIRYTANGSFDTVIDSFRQDPYYLQFKNDTCTLNLDASVNSDWKLKFPTTGQVVAVTNIKVIGSMTKEVQYPCGKGPAGYCSNPMLSCTINGVDIKYADPNSWPMYYIHK